MMAVDTNVIVPVIAGDDPTQEELARHLFDINEIYVSLAALNRRLARIAGPGAPVPVELIAR